MKTVKKCLLILIIIAVLMTTGLVYAPGFLLYSTDTAKVDAIILLLGPDFNARQKHAHELIKKGMAGFLIIPAYNKTYSIDQGVIKPLPNKADKNNLNGKINPAAPRYYEDTHLELIEANKTMKLFGQKSAIFVSSPYHMRRIHLIVHKEFDQNADYYFSPTPYEIAPKNIWELKGTEWKKLWREYIKMIWFMIYSPWTK